MKIVAFGIPYPKGSKKLFGTYTDKETGAVRGRMGDSGGKGLSQWNKAVEKAGRAAMMGAPPMDGALVARFVFTMPKPASAPKTRRTYPNKKPDIDKILRSTMDALTKAGVYVDDARVVETTRLAKVFPGEDPEALDQPGVRITVEVIA